MTTKVGGCEEPAVWRGVHGENHTLVLERQPLARGGLAWIDEFELPSRLGRRSLRFGLGRHGNRDPSTLHGRQRPRCRQQPEDVGAGGWQPRLLTSGQFHGLPGGLPILSVLFPREYLAIDVG